MGAESGVADKTMLTDRAMQHYRKRCRETLDKGLSRTMGMTPSGLLASTKGGR